jgi:hypothetical protein
VSCTSASLRLSLTAIGRARAYDFRPDEGGPGVPGFAGQRLKLMLSNALSNISVEGSPVRAYSDRLRKEALGAVDAQTAQRIAAGNADSARQDRAHPHQDFTVSDLLTSSATPGHAMKAVDRERCLGALLGKALKPLESGCGLIPMLIALQ